MDLVREIMVALEGASRPIPASAFVGEGRTREEVCYHLRIMRDAGLIDAIVRFNPKGLYGECLGVDLTWEGHEFLANIRDDSVWGEVKMRVAQSVGDASLEVFKGVALHLVKAAVLSQTGISL